MIENQYLFSQTPKIIFITFVSNIDLRVLYDIVKGILFWESQENAKNCSLMAILKNRIDSIIKDKFLTLSTCGSIPNIISYTKKTLFK